MPWGKLDDQLHDNEKVWSFTDKEFRVWMYSISYCNKKRRRDPAGTLTQEAAETVCRLAGASRKVMQGVVAKRGWDRTDTGYLVHDFPKYGPKEDKTAPDRQRRHRDKGDGDADENADVTPDVTPVSRRDIRPDAPMRGSPVPVPGPVPTPQVATTPEQPPKETDSKPEGSVLRAELAPIPKVPPVVQAKHQAIYRALSERCGPPANDAERGKFGRAAKLLAQAGATSDEVFDLADALEQRWPEAECTPMAIANNVSILRAPAKSAKNGSGLGSRLAITARAVAALEAEGR